MQTYNASLFDPPAPLAKVMLRNTQNGLTLSDVSLLIDSDSDVTIIPQASANQIGVNPIEDAGYEVEGFKGSPMIMPVVHLGDVIFESHFQGSVLVDRSRLWYFGKKCFEQCGDFV